MGDILQNFISSVEKNYPKNKNKILDALDFATKSHFGIKRKSGEPYIIHPIAVAQILVNIMISIILCMPIRKISAYALIKE